MLNFREFHLFNILNGYDEQYRPLDAFLSHYFRAHKAAGPKDRRWISEAVYDMMRWRGLLDHLCNGEPSWENRFEVYKQFQPERYAHDTTIPPHVRVSFPKPLFSLFADSFGEERAIELSLESNRPAPTTLRVNTLKTTRDELFKKWEGVHPVSLSSVSPWGIIFQKRINFFAMEEFKQGLFEIQDEGSQLIATLFQMRAKELILDYCAGAGGKALAIAPLMQKRGQLYLHDIRPWILDEAKKRLRRAGVQNAQILLPDDPKKESLKEKFDWVLVDSPCSGTGTLRRNPDMKWKFEPSTIDNLVEDQRKIFEEALSYMHPKGRIIYATCSILPQENQQQIAYFKEKFNLELVSEPFQSFPIQNGMDGFFGAVLKRSS